MPDGHQHRSKATDVDRQIVVLQGTTISRCYVPMLGYEPFDRLSSPRLACGRPGCLNASLFVHICHISLAFANGASEVNDHWHQV